MSSLWTPSGEYVPKRDGSDAAVPPPTAPGGTDVPGTAGAPASASADAQAAVDAMRAELAATPPEVVVANHCYGLFELAAVYLSQVPPMLYQARLAIDALGALLDGLRGRLGEAEPSLLESISQLRLAYVRLEGAEHSAAVTAAGSDSAANGHEATGQPGARSPGDRGTTDRAS